MSGSAGSIRRKGFTGSTGDVKEFRINALSLADLESMDGMVVRVTRAI
jgi:hypothetical protein